MNDGAMGWVGLFLYLAHPPSFLASYGCNYQVGSPEYHGTHILTCTHGLFIWSRDAWAMLRCLSCAPCLYWRSFCSLYLSRSYHLSPVRPSLPGNILWLSTNGRWNRREVNQIRLDHFSITSCSLSFEMCIRYVIRSCHSWDNLLPVNRYIIRTSSLLTPQITCILYAPLVYWDNILEYFFSLAWHSIKWKSSSARCIKYVAMRFTLLFDNPVQSNNHTLTDKHVTVQ